MGNKFEDAVKKRNAELESKKKETKNEELTKESKNNVEINIDNLFDGDDEKKSKNKTFYLEEIVINTLEKTAKKQKVSDSKFLNELLKHIFKL